MASQETGCHAVATPSALPAAEVLVDSAALQARLAPYLSVLDPPPAGYVMLSLANDSSGRNTRREVIAHTTSPAVADSVQKMVFAELRTAEHAGLPWNVRLLVAVGHAVPAIRVARSEACPPRPRDPTLEARVQSAPAIGVRYRRGAREHVLLVRLEVAPNGTVRAADVTRGPPMTTDLQRRIADYTRRLFFHPATLDGRPVTGWIEVPLTIRD